MNINGEELDSAFPMPGKYHFRFKSPLIPGTDREKGAVAVWMDCVDNDQHVGVGRNDIVAKVTNINMDDEGESPGYANSHGHAPSPPPVRRQTPAAAARRSAPSQPIPQPSPAAAAAEGDILGVFEEPTATGNLSDQGQPSEQSPCKNVRLFAENIIPSSIVF